VSRKHTKDEDEIVKENEMVLEGETIKDEDLELISAKLTDLKLRKRGRFHIRLLRIIERVFYYLYENVTRVSEEFACISYKYTRCTICLAMR